MNYYACVRELLGNTPHLLFRSLCSVCPFRTVQCVFVSEKLPISSASFPHRYPLNLYKCTFGFFEFEKADSVLPNLLSLLIKSVKIKATLTLLLFLKHILKKSYSCPQLSFASGSRSSLWTIVSKLMLKIIIFLTLESKLSSDSLNLRNCLSLNFCNDLLSFFR